MSADAFSREEARRALQVGAPVSTDEVLKAAGDLLRRGEHTGLEGVEEALRRLERPRVEEWLRGQQPEGLRATLLRAAEEAVEAALGDGAEEAELWRASALEGLRARDRAASAVRALGEWERLHGPLPEAPKSTYLSALGRLDTALRPRARWFIPLNPRRRQERDMLNPSERTEAWWFSSRAGCDELVATWTGRPQPLPPHLQDCGECREDMEATALVDAPPRRHLSADELWRLDMGLMSEDERARVELHTAKCSECGQAVEALEVGEEAIEAAVEMDEAVVVLAAARASRAPEPMRLAARHPEQREVLEERRDVRVVLVRERQRLRLLVQPLSGRTVTAAVFLTPGRPSLKPQQEAEGLAFDLTSAAASGAHSAHLSLQVGTETLERDFTF